MYKKYSGPKRWSFEMLSESLNTEGGLKEASASISGNSVFAFLKVFCFTSFILFMELPLAGNH